MHILLACILGYLTGTVNPAYIIGKHKGCNVKELGSKNAGASNALLLFGKTAGIACALFDIIKPWIAVWLCSLLYPTTTLSFALTTASCILGHLFPFYIRFNGGKGLACLGGTVLAFDWRLFLVLLVIEAVVVFTTDYLCLVPVTGVVLFVVAHAALTHDPVSTAVFAVAALAVIAKHMINLYRIGKGTELRFSYLWNKEKELERVIRNMENDES